MANKSKPSTEGKIQKGGRNESPKSERPEVRPQPENKPAPFLTDEPEEGVKYITPNIDIDLPVHKRQECRDILLEIRRFGVSQRQFLYLIQLIALELESREAMLAILDAVSKNRQNVPVSKLILPKDE